MKNISMPAQNGRQFRIVTCLTDSRCLYLNTMLYKKILLFLCLFVSKHVNCIYKKWLDRFYFFRTIEKNIIFLDICGDYLINCFLKFVNVNTSTK